MKRLFYLTIIVFVTLVNGASAALVAQLDGPTEYGPPKMVVLPTVTVGDEGYLELEFKADSLANISAPIWYMADVYGGSGAGGEYRLYMWDNAICAALWNTGGYAAQTNIPFNDTTEWHSASLAWKEGAETLLTLDGVTNNVTNTHTLADFTSGAGVHVLGAYPSGGAVVPLFNGSVRNMLLCDTYEKSASVVAQHDGPTSFASNTLQVLPSVTIGDEGTLELEFKADSTANSCLWYMADVWGGSTGEYRLYFWQGNLVGTLWNSGKYAAQVNIPFTDTTDWHTLSMTWKQGEEFYVTLDGVPTATNNYGPAPDATLADFTSGEGMNVLGGYPSGGSGSQFFDGMTRNVKIYDTYNNPIPEPGALLMLSTAAAGFLLCIRRKQRD